MATNPMQRKARNSFLLGMFVMLLLCGAIIAVLFVQLINKTKAEQEEKKATTNAYVLKQDVTSGQVITTDMLEIKPVNKNLVPSNATSNLEIITNYALKDKEGNEITTKYENNTAKLSIRIDNKDYELQKEKDTDNYYITRNDDKQYIELNSVPLVAKVNMKRNTLITTDLLSKSDNMVQKDVRKQEYNMLVLPMDLKTGDYIDVRLMLPSGQDYIVVSKKEVNIPNIAGTDSEDTIWMNLSEDEILHMSCAIVDAYQIRGSKIYVTKYTEAGMQEAAKETYPVNNSTYTLLESDPNVLEKAMNEIKRRYDETTVKLRNEYVNGAIENQADQAQGNLEANMQESTTKSKSNRKQYLDSLTGVVE